MTPNLLFRTLLGALLLCWSNCAVVNRPGGVDVSIQNRSSRIIENCRARFGHYACSWGDVTPPFMSIYGAYPHPITPDTELHWVANGQPKVQAFDLRKVVPAGKAGRLAFTVYDDRAEVAFIEAAKAGP